MGVWGGGGGCFWLVGCLLGGGVWGWGWWLERDGWGVLERVLVEGVWCVGWVGVVKLVEVRMGDCLVGWVGVLIGVVVMGFEGVLVWRDGKGFDGICRWGGGEWGGWCSEGVVGFCGGGGLFGGLS
uniref:Uncharacterized protein n=1 Tax=Knipowitschia caucasica TaxID=637954 RepID=A0AAV2J4D8_KNICA